MNQTSLPIIIARCNNCCAVIIGENPEHREPCENCKGLTRIFSVSIEEKAFAEDFLGYKHKSPNFKGKGKTKAELVDRIEDSKFGNGKLVRHIRLIDRENDYYFEKVMDRETALVIHEVSEKLSDHKNHGSAKKNNLIINPSFPVPA